MSPRVMAAFKNRGVSYEKKGELERAFLEYRVALSFDPNRHEVTGKEAADGLKRIEQRLAVGGPKPEIILSLRDALFNDQRTQEAVREEQRQRSRRQQQEAEAAAVRAKEHEEAIARIQAIKLQAQYYNYGALAREPEKYAGVNVVFEGKVIQVIESGLDTQLRVNVTKNSYNLWNDTILVNYRRQSSSEPRILEGDIIKFYGKYGGIISYKAIFGQTIQIPHVAAAIIENETAR